MSHAACRSAYVRGLLRGAMLAVLYICLTHGRDGVTCCEGRSILRGLTDADTDSGVEPTIANMATSGCLQAISAPADYRDYQYSDSYFAICTVVKDQGQDLREFVDYHRWIGVTKFYIYDHNSSMPLLVILQDYVRSGIVEYSIFSGHHDTSAKRVFKGTAQGYAYRQCLANARRRHRWVAFIDTDEFIILKEERATEEQPDINTFMRAYEPYGALGVNWRVFGTSGHKTRPSGGVLASYHKCMPELGSQNQHIKSIVNVQFTLSIGTNPHYFRYWKNATAVNEAFVPISSDPALAPFSRPPSTHRIALHHYVTKSLADYRQKTARGGGSGSVKGDEFLRAVEVESTDSCTDAMPLYNRCCAFPHPINMSSTFITMPG